MKFIKTKFLITLSILVIAILTICSVINAFYSSEDPQITLNIIGDSIKGLPIFKQEGSILDGNWVPGTTKKGTIRINNNYSSPVKVYNLGLTETLKKDNIEDLESITIDFLESMKLSIINKNEANLSQVIFDESMLDMRYKKDSDVFWGFDLGPGSFTIDNGQYIDLEYKIHMDETAGNNLQGIAANIDFIINSKEIYQRNQNIGLFSLWKEIQIVDVKSLDIPAAVVEHDCFKSLTEKDIIDIYFNKNIKIKRYITRAEIAVLIGKALNLDTRNSTGEKRYKDDLPEWAAGHINLLTKKGIFSGYEDNTFRPNKLLTRQEMMAALVRAFNKKLTNNFELSFKDTSKISPWAVSYLKTGFASRIMESYADNTFRPKAYITRTETYKALCKVLDLHE